MEKENKCCFCNKQIKGYGNNSLPIMEGRCCDYCNDRLVVPFRIKMSFVLEQHKNYVLESHRLKQKSK